MKRVLFTLVLLSSIFLGPNAYPAKKGFGSSEETYKVIIPLGLGLVSYYSHVGVSLQGGALFKISNVHPLYLGFETGLDFMGSYYYHWYTDGVTRGFVGIPLMGAAMYRFEIGKVPSLHPYAAIALGPYISTSTGRGVVLELAFRPGVSWQFQQGLALHGEVRFGIIGSGFFIMPSAGITFLL